jgi:hypothetical protein
MWALALILNKSGRDFSRPLYTLKLKLNQRFMMAAPA